MHWRRCCSAPLLQRHQSALWLHILQAGYRLYGYEKGELEGKNISMLM